MFRATQLPGTGPPGGTNKHAPAAAPSRTCCSASLRPASTFWILASSRTGSY